jgi:hypothetical protein
LRATLGVHALALPVPVAALFLVESAGPGHADRTGHVVPPGDLCRDP